ncbi:MAG TPA: hypothetical protein VF288_10645 [Mycobacteriales bacterium]
MRGECPYCSLALVGDGEDPEDYCDDDLYDFLGWHLERSKWCEKQRRSEAYADRAWRER